jgi:hypothetical protein
MAQKQHRFKDIFYVCSVLQLHLEVHFANVPNTLRQYDLLFPPSEINISILASQVREGIDYDQEDWRYVDHNGDPIHK